LLSRHGDHWDGISSTSFLLWTLGISEDKEQLLDAMAPLKRTRMQHLTLPRWPPGWLRSVEVKNPGLPGS
jgi:hypothetical protein